MRENTDQNNSEHEHFRAVYACLFKMTSQKIDKV